MKYLIAKASNGKELPLIVLFPDHMPHREMAFAIQEEFPLYDKISGAKISFPLEAIDNIFLHGWSTDLGTKPCDEDEKLIKLYLKQQTL